MVAVCMAVGGMVGATLGARWLTRISDERLHAAVRALLVSIGLLLIVESVVPWTSARLSVGPIVEGAVAALAGVIVGAVRTILGVAGGELIIPTLLLLFGVPIKVAGTTSLLISIPTMLVGLARHRAQGAFQGVAEVRRIVMPMGLGTIIGSAAGGFLVACAPTGGVKVLLGAVLIASAFRAFQVRP
jgi:uncharacterized membrane protein YfcA